MLHTLHENLLLLVIGVPFIGAIITVAFPSNRPQLLRWWALGIATVGLSLSSYIFLTYDVGDAGYQFSRQITWLPSLDISLRLGVDGISSPLLLLNGVVFLAGVLISWNITHRPKDFFVWLMLLVAGVYGVFTALDLFFLFFFYELAVLPMYLLIAVWGSTTDFGTFIRTKEYGAMKLVLYLVAGSVLVWLSIIALWVDGGKTFNILALEEVTFTRNFQILYFPILAIGFGILAGLWPFHTWSPDGHVAAPTAVSMLHAGVLMKLGAYGILRVSIVLLPEGAEFWAPVLLGLGTVNVLYGAIAALAQKDLKYVVGYSSVSHMGYVLMGLSTLNAVGLDGAVLQMFSHGIMTALFFALIGIIYERTHVRDIGVLEGLARRMGITAGLFSVAGLASLGLPGLSGFVAEFLIFLGLFRTYPIMAILGVIGAAITAVYILRLIAKVFFGPLDDRWNGLKEAGRRELFASLFLVGFLILWGVYPWYIVDLIDTSIAPIAAVFSGAGIP